MWNFNYDGYSYILLHILPDIHEFLIYMLFIMVLS